jgi:sulfite exporter TauE/SafE
MTAEIIGRAILLAGAFLLVLGPGLQARMEMREFHELLDALIERDAPAVTRTYLELLAVGPSMALHSPLGAVKFLGGAWGWYPRFRVARRAFAASGAAGDERVVHIQSHLTRARNWAIVVAGSMLIFAGAAVELGQTVLG